MIPKKSRFSTYNDGMLRICEPEDSTSDFGAVQNALTEDDLTVLVKLAYKEMSKRDQDLDFAESQGRTLSMKVKCRLYPASKNNLVLIGNVLHSIIHLDEDRAAQEMYLYLEEVRTLHERTEQDQGHTDNAGS